MPWNSVMQYCLGIALGFLILFIWGCASSPVTNIFVDKSVNIEQVNDVDFDYESNAAVDSEASLEGTIAPKTDLKLK